MNSNESNLNNLQCKRGHWKPTPMSSTTNVVVEFSHFRFIDRRTDSDDEQRSSISVVAAPVHYYAPETIISQSVEVDHSCTMQRELELHIKVRLIHSIELETGIRN